MVLDLAVASELLFDCAFVSGLRVPICIQRIHISMITN